MSLVEDARLAFVVALLVVFFSAYRGYTTQPKKSLFGSHFGPLSMGPP